MAHLCLRETRPWLALPYGERTKKAEAKHKNPGRGRGAGGRTRRKESMADVLILVPCSSENPIRSDRRKLPHTDLELFKHLVHLRLLVAHRWLDLERPRAHRKLAGRSFQEVQGQRNSYVTCLSLPGRHLGYCKFPVIGFKTRGSYVGIFFRRF